jgi:DNA replication factor GINS
MDIEKLWGILYKERNTASLQELPETFCEEVSEYMEKLAEEKGEADERRRELVEDEIRNARMKVEDIIRRRIGKIVKLASSGMKTAPKGMLEEEQMIFEGVKSHVEEGKEKIFALILGEKEGKSEKMDAEKENEKDVTHFDQTFSKFDEASSPAPVPAKNKNEELHIVRILEDIPTFMGTDGRIYKVRKEDVIMLPKTNAEILCKRGVAVRFEGEKRREEKVSTGGIEK